MKHIKKFLVPTAVPTLFGTIIVLLSLNTCQKFNVDGFLFFTTDTIQALGGGSYSLKGSIDDVGEDAILEHGFCWSEQRNPTTNGSSSEEGTIRTAGGITSTVSGLSPNTTYFYRAYVITIVGTEYANEKSFDTESNAPTVITSSISSYTETTAQGGGNVTSDGGSTITARGVCWSTAMNPTITNDKTTQTGTTGSFTSSIGGLTCGTTYYVRAYATNSASTEYGDQVQFTTSECPSADPPTVTTTSVSGPTETTAIGGGNVTDDGGATIINRGICWSTSMNPDTTDSKTKEPGTTGSYTSSLTGLTCGTTYYVKAYATNSTGITYGNQEQFSTTACTADPPTVTTTNVTGATETTAQGGGNVTSDGGATIIARGVCWSTSPNPDITDDKTTQSGTTGSFASSIGGLTCGTTYYVKAYASNSSGTNYGDEVQFTTTQCPVTAPSVTTNTVTGETETTAQGGGNVTSDGGATITARGVCWSTSPNPDITNPKTTQSGTTGSFTSSIGGLTCGTTYYVKAYATNSEDTSYGDEVQFTTLQCPVYAPTVTTSSISSYTETTAQGGGNVTSDGGATITARGVCWSTSPNPDITNDKTTQSGTTGSFTSSIGGLTCGTTYYVKAYATNSEGTRYGDEEQFTTLQCPVANKPTVTTSSVTGVGTTTAQGGGNVTNDGGGTITARGVCWNTTGNPTTSDPKTTDPGTTGSYSSSITGLLPFTTYYVRAYATNSAGTSYGSVEYTIKTFWDNGTITDVQGNPYNTYQIEDQVWMTEDMMATKYADGTDIDIITGTSAWSGQSYSNKAYCWYDNNSSYGPTYGALYTWAAAMNGQSSSSAVPSSVQGVCPDGWHIPSDEEWKLLEINLGMSRSLADQDGVRGTGEGGALKEETFDYWESPNVGGSNISGFTARGSGYRTPGGGFGDLNRFVLYWTATIGSGSDAWTHSLGFTTENVGHSYETPTHGLSVRCMKD